jgi:hypothetical protein
MLALEFATAVGGVETLNSIGRRVDRDGNATLLGEFERPFIEASIAAFQTRDCPVSAPSIQQQ